MGCYVRAFCAAKQTPTINTVLQSLRQAGYNFTPHVDDPSELDSPLWQKFELQYNEAKNPIVVECNRDDVKECLARAEIKDFVETIALLENAPAKGTVIDRLNKTRFIICCQLLSDIDEDGFEANGLFLHYFVERCDGMIQADGEGFYEGTDLLLPLK